MSFEAQNNQVLWRSVFILDPTTGQPNSSTYPVYVTAQITPPTTVYNGQITLAAVAAPLSATSVPIKSVTIENPNTNAVVYVGGSTVTAANGYALRPGATVSLDISDLTTVYVLGTAGEVVSYIAVN